jgi:hypothetical protein
MLDGHANQIAGPRPALRQMSGLPASQGAWIFVSHSNRDFDKVRHVRDTLESAGHRPLLFFLKSLDDDSEIDGLIKAEIDAREWFILCDSANSRASNWVGREVAYIRTLGDKGLHRDRPRRSARRPVVEGPPARAPGIGLSDLRARRFRRGRVHRRPPARARLRRLPRPRPRLER